MTSEPVQFYVCYVAAEPDGSPVVGTIGDIPYPDRASAEAVAAGPVEPDIARTVIAARTVAEALDRAHDAFGLRPS